MKEFYTLLGCIVWNRVMEIAKRIQKNFNATHN